MPEETKELVSGTAEKPKRAFNVQQDLDETKQGLFEYVQSRIQDLQLTRQSQYGFNLEKIWADADKDYVPHRLGTGGKRVIATDEEKGWRGALVTLGTSEWQSDISQANPFVKIGIALSILVDQNPSGAFTPTSKKFQATNELIKQLYQRSWDVARSKEQLKLYVFNLAKYGWAVARTYPYYRERKVKVIKKYNQEDPSQNEYEDKTVVEYNDIFRENLDPWNTWIDDMARPNNPFSIRDWAWRKVYAFDDAEEEFSKYPFWEYVKPGGNTDERVTSAKGQESNKFQEKKLVEILFYENRIKDLFMVIANGVPIIIEPLPISDAKGLKKLSLWQTYWNLRHAQCPYGIGLYEAIRFEQALVDRIRNMTIDQLTLMIYKMFFYQGTQALTDTGDIRITPGSGKQVLDPKNIKWLEVPGPGQEAWMGLDYFKKDLDEVSGITDPLLGIVTGKTAFEIAQAKEAALKRLKTPLDNILDSLNTEGYITVSLIQLLYSIPEVYQISDPGLIEDYLKEIQSDPELYSRDEENNFSAIVYPEFPLNLDKDEKGNLIETAETRFFRVKPGTLAWEGIINIKSQSLLSPSKQVDKALDLEMYNILIPLLLQPPEIYGKVAKAIVKLYDKDPKDILPDIWMQEQPPTNQPLMVSAGQAPPEQQQPQTAQALSQNPPSVVGQISSKMSAPFKKI